MRTVGETLVALLEAYGVDTVFGIPGVHTIELYRGLARSRIRHVTPRHEQGAGFMADGYARVSGRPGVAFVITGPGLTNTITAMAQARADSVPILVISGVNRRETLGRGLGFLHELPDQRAMMATLALFSARIERGADLPDVLARAFALFSSSRPGPVHVEIPIDVMGEAAVLPAGVPSAPRPPAADPALIEQAAGLCATAKRPLILAGGGARGAETPLRLIAQHLDAPVVATANARGLLHGHPLLVPASPSLAPVRALMAASDLVLALGTELGPTDYDMYGDGGFALPANMIRIDIDAGQLQRRPARLALQADCREALDALLAALSGANAHDLTPTPNPSPQGGGGPSGISVPRSPRGSSATAATSSPSPLWGGVWDHKPVPPGQVLSNASGGTDRAAAARQNARAGLDAGMRAQLAVIETVRDTLPGAIIVGDSTQPVYAGNLYYDHDRPGGWFNAATGYGALGYALPAAIGAALANPAATVVCLAGDGGFQFTLPEIGVAAELGLPVILLVWNNEGYREIETSMRSAGVEPVGVSPAPPDFQKIAAAYGIAARRLASLDALPAALRRARASGKPCLIEIGRDLTG